MSMVANLSTCPHPFGRSETRNLGDQKDLVASLSSITERSFMIPLSQEITQGCRPEEETGCRRWTIVYATGPQRKIVLVVTGDRHFGNLPGVEMI